MKFKLLILLMLSLYSMKLHAFTSYKKDSAPPSKEKTMYLNNIEILTGLSNKVYLKNPERSLQYAQTALEIARKHNDTESEAKILGIIGDTYKRSDLDRLSIPYYQEAIKLAGKTPNSIILPDLLMNLGEAYYKLNLNDSATNNYIKSLELYELQKNQSGIAGIYRRLGNTYWYSAGYDKSLELYLKALNIYERLNNKSGISEIYTNIGALYNLLGDYKNASKYFSKVLPYLGSFEKPENLSNFYYRYGNMFENIKQYDSAFYYYGFAKSILDSSHLEQKSGYIDLSISSIYFSLGKTDKAIINAKAALVLFERYQNKFGISITYNCLSNYYLKQEDYTNSLRCLTLGFNLAKKINSINLLKTTYLNFSDYYRKKEIYKKSLEYYTLYQQMNDSVLNQEKNTRIAELQAKYDTEKKEKELIAKTKEISRNIELINRQKRNLYIFGIGIIVIFIMSIALYRQYKLIDAKGKHIQEINEELDQRVKERTEALQLTQFSVDHAADPIFWIGKNGHLLFANHAACNYLNFSKEELLTQKITSVIPRFSLSDWDDIWDLIRNEGSLVLELNFQKKNKVSFPVEIALNYIAHEGKEYAFAFIRDISDRKLKEENLRNAKEKAEVADKLKSAFLANMSHEIRTPMNAILGFSDLLLGDDLTLADKQEFANIIKSSADTLLKLIDDIIDISLIDAGQLKMNNCNFHLNNTLKEINRFYQQEKTRVNKPHLDIRLNESTFNDQIVLNTDPVRFRQIITNLVGNALKFTDTGFIEIGYIPSPNKLKIYVKDSGIGIEQKKIPIIFERFSKLNDGQKLYGGTGLGLAISKKMIEQMGGNLSAASEPTKGSIFWFTIPYQIMSNNLNIEVKTEKINTKKISWNKKKLLIVEDIESNYLFLETILKRTKINIFWAKDGPEALAYCKENIPDAVLMDIQLPVMDGYTVTREILSIYPNTPIIAQTAYAFITEKEKILEAGCLDYLTKPIDATVLLETLQKYIN